MVNHGTKKINKLEKNSKPLIATLTKKCGTKIDDVTAPCRRALAECIVQSVIGLTMES